MHYLLKKIKQKFRNSFLISGGLLNPLSFDPKDFCLNLNVKTTPNFDLRLGICDKSVLKIPVLILIFPKTSDFIKNK